MNIVHKKNKSMVVIDPMSLRTPHKHITNTKKAGIHMKKNNTFILILFLLGIFMGAIDTGIVSPSREIIQNGFGIAEKTGIWMITIYTLAYAVSMPITGKMADRFGHKQVYTFGIAVFGFGSLLCGLTNFIDSFSLLLVARVIQAIGAGGILPIATTVIGQSFPEEKRGTALGFVGMVYGVATIIGPTLGSFIIQIAGKENWGYIFFINFPISLAIIILSSLLPTTHSKHKSPIDFAGSFVIGGFIASLMYALTNLDFFHFLESITSVEVYLFLGIAILLLPVIVAVEKRAKDPIINLSYFKDSQMLIILTIALITGIGMMGMVFVPQFAENTLKIPSGNGGYLVTLLAVFSGFAAPISGKLLDKKGAGFVLKLGFLFNMVGALVLALWAAKAMTFLAVGLGLMFMGFGVGFTMGAPLNYLVLNRVSKEEGASSLATMSLIRSIGVAISPNIMIGFIANAGSNVFKNITEAVFPDQSQMLSATTNAIPQDVLMKIQTADVTNIAVRTEEFLKAVVPKNVQNFVIPVIQNSTDLITDTFQKTINTGYSQMFIASAVIAFVGFLFTFFVKRKTV